MATTIDTTPATSSLILDTNPADTITVADGPPESGFQTTAVSYGAGANAYIFANKTNFTLDGGAKGDKVFLDNPDPAAGLTSLTIQDLGAGSTITGVNPNAGSPDIAVATLVMSADAGIGTAARPLRTQTGTLNAITGTGGIFVNNNAAAPGTLNIGNGTGGVRVIGASGDLSLINNGTIAMANAVDVVAGPGNITMKAQGAAADLDLSGQQSNF